MSTYYVNVFPSSPSYKQYNFRVKTHIKTPPYPNTNKAQYVLLYIDQYAG